MMRGTAPTVAAIIAASMAMSPATARDAVAPAGPRDASSSTAAMPSPRPSPAAAPTGATMAARIGAPIAESEVRAAMQALEAAARRRDVDALAAMLADDCRIELRTRIDGREQVTRFTKAEYVGMLGGGYAAMRDLQSYDYELADVAVTVAPDGRSADVRARVRETAVLAGRTLVTHGDEQSRLERRDGRLAFVAVTATTEAAAPR
jgi:ketosteroid isomerase-like protein